MQGANNNYHIVATTLSSSLDGSVVLFVNQDIGSDLYDGLSRGSPKKTIGSALNEAYPWCTIYVDKGVYAENLILDHANSKLIGMSRGGTNPVIVQPAAGTAMAIQEGNCLVQGMSIRSNAATAIEVLDSDVRLNNLHISTMGIAKGIDLQSGDNAHITDVYVDGNAQTDAIGVYFNADTNDAVLENSTVTSCGSGLGEAPIKNGYGIAVADSAKDCIIQNNIITDCRNGIYLYQAAAPSRYKGHAIYRNDFSSNSLWDVYDNNGREYQIDIAENFYCYSGKYESDYLSGHADLVIPCGNNMDYRPLASRHSWKTQAIARRVA